MNNDKISVELIKNMDCVFTHGGVFHADDVFSAALLKTINPDIEIIRGFKVPDNFQGLVFDIGGGTYDHHQADNEIRENGIPYASFGKLWRDLGPGLAGDIETERFDKSIVQSIDYTDNTGEKNPLSSMISSFNPNWDDDNKTNDKFYEVLKFVSRFIQNKIEACKSKEHAKEIVEKALLTIDVKGIIVLPQFAPWSDTLIPSEAKLVIFPSQRGGFNLQVISKSFKEREPKVKLPEKWAGQEEEILRNEIPELSFCHAGGFLAAFDTLEGAKKGAEIAIEESEKLSINKDESVTHILFKRLRNRVLSLIK